MMLAMPLSPVPHHDGHHHVPVMSSTTVTLSQLSTPGGSSQVRTSRPRLCLNTTLNTSKPRTFGKGSSLSLNTLSAESPTVKNTFVNAYESIPERSTVLRPKLLIDPAVGQDQDFTAPSDQGSLRTPSNSSASSASTAFEQQAKFLYTQPKGVVSILVTSLIHRSYHIRMSGDKPGLVSKRVSFRDPIDEEIKTLRYIMAHSDIKSESALETTESSDVSPIVALMPEPSKSNMSDQPVFDFQVPSPRTTEINFSSPPPQKTARNSILPVPRRDLSPAAPIRMKRDSSSDEDSDEGIPQTPVAGRCKKRRQWAWTLDPLPGQKSDEGLEKPDGSVVSHDDDSVSTSSRFSEASSS